MVKDIVKYCDMVFDPVQWNALDPITSTKLNQMVENDKFLRNRKVAGILRNVDLTGNTVNSPRYIKENLVMVSGYREIKPGGTFPDAQVDGVDHVKPVFEKEINLPKGFFDPTYHPVVVCTVGTKRGIKKIVYSLKSITSSSFIISIRELEDNINFTSDMEYFISYLAMGVKAPSVG